jgi:hypothetical protein
MFLLSHGLQPIRNFHFEEEVDLLEMIHAFFNGMNSFLPFPTPARNPAFKRKLTCTMPAFPRSRFNENRFSLHRIWFQIWNPSRSRVVVDQEEVKKWFP